MNNLRGTINKACSVWVYNPTFNILIGTRVKFGLFSYVGNRVRFEALKLMFLEER